MEISTVRAGQIRSVCNEKFSFRRRWRSDRTMPTIRMLRIRMSETKNVKKGSVKNMINGVQQQSR